MVGDTIMVETNETSVTLPIIASGKGAQTQTMSSTGITPTPTVRDSQAVDTFCDVAWQREQGRLDALRTAATLIGNGGTANVSVAPSQVVVPTTPAVVGGLALEESDIGTSSRQVPIGSIAPSAEGYIWPRHPDAQYVDVFPPEISLNQQDINLRLNSEEGWRLLYPFREPDVRRL